MSTAACRKTVSRIARRAGSGRPVREPAGRRLAFSRHARAMAAVTPAAGDYDAYAGQYAANVA
jgi:hypothetical protein